MCRKHFRSCGKRYEVTGEWRNKEELSDLYSLPNIVRVVKSRRMRWVEHVARMGEGKGLHRVWKPDGKRQLGRPRLRYEDNIMMDLQEVGAGCGDWMELAWRDPDVDGNIILRLIFRKWDVGVWTGSTWLRIGTDGGDL